MKKYIIIAAMFTACLALCAAVWSQTKTTEKAYAPIQVSAVSAPELTVEGIAAEAGTTPLPTGEEKIEMPQAEPIREDISDLGPVPEETPVIAEVESAPEPESEPVPTTELAPAPAPSQTGTEPQSSDMVYVPGFGWLECQGLGEVIHDESMYENGNKIGVMG